MAQANSLGSVSSTLTSVLTTIGVGTLLVMWPVFLFSRVQEVRTSNLGVQLRPEDPMLLVAGVLWIGLLVAVLSVRRPMRRVPNSLTDLRTAFQGAIAPTYFGVGDFRGWTKTNPAAQLADLQTPTTENDEPEFDGESEAVPETETEFATPQTATSELRTVEPTLTRPYECGRRESWWSISEGLFGDASEWQVIRDLNVGREVVDGVVLTTNTPLRSGWSLLVPVEPSRRVDGDDDS